MITSHGRLRFSWCRSSKRAGIGLARVQMSLTLCEEGTRASQQQLAERVEGKSVWTVDLAYLLVEYGVDVKYWTDLMHGRVGVQWRGLLRVIAGQGCETRQSAVGAASAEGVHGKAHAERR